MSPPHAALRSAARETLGVFRESQPLPEIFFYEGEFASSYDPTPQNLTMLFNRDNRNYA